MDNKRKHLEMLQGVITRMATNSFQIKGWSVVLVSALFALAAGDAQRLFVPLAYFPAIAFWVLDGYFLWQEQLFRKLYDRVRLMDEAEVDFSMKPSVDDSEGESWVRAVFSTTLLIFHGVIVASIVVVMVVLAFVK